MRLNNKQQNFGHYPKFKESVADLTDLQIWQLSKHLITLYHSETMDEFKQKTQCPTLPLKHKENYYAIDLSKNGTGQSTIKLTIFLDEDNDLLWIIKCALITNNNN